MTHRLPPLHPPLVHFPIVLVTISVGADIAGLSAGSLSIGAAAWWALAGGAVGAVLSVIAGLYDMRREKIDHEAHEYVHIHMKMGIMLFVAISGLTFWRWTIYTVPGQFPGWEYISGAFVVVVLTLLQGFVGGELVASYGVGVAPTGQGTIPSGQAKHRLSWLDWAKKRDPESSVGGGANASSENEHSHH